MAAILGGQTRLPARPRSLAGKPDGAPLRAGARRRAAPRAAAEAGGGAAKVVCLGEALYGADDRQRAGARTGLLPCDRSFPCACARRAGPGVAPAPHASVPAAGPSPRPRRAGPRSRRARAAADGAHPPAPCRLAPPLLLPALHPYPLKPPNH
jgi:hypothetical protein